MAREGMSEYESEISALYVYNSVHLVMTTFRRKIYCYSFVLGHGYES